MLSEEWKYTVKKKKKISRNINDDQEIFSDDSDEEASDQSDT